MYVLMESIILLYTREKSAVYPIQIVIKYFNTTKIHLNLNHIDLNVVNFIATLQYVNDLHNMMIKNSIILYLKDLDRNAIQLYQLNVKICYKHLGINV